MFHRESGVLLSKSLSPPGFPYCNLLEPTKICACRLTAFLINSEVAESNIEHPGIDKNNNDSRSALEHGRALTDAALRRVLIVAPQPFYEDRGTPIAVRQVVIALAKLGYAVDILTYPVGTDIDVKNTRVLRSANPFRIRSVAIGFSARKILLDLVLTVSLIRQLRRERYAVIHAVEEMAIPAAWLARWHDTRLIYDMQSCLPNQLQAHAAFRPAVVQRGLQRIEKWLINSVDLVACSTGLTDYVHFVDPEARVIAWGFAGEPVTMDLEAPERIRRHLGIADEQSVVMYTGNCHVFQGLSLLIEAMPEILRSVPNTVLVVVGATDDDHLEAGAAASSLIEQGALKIVPRQPRERISEYLDFADVVVSPRIHGENIPLKIYTYMAARRPIVATNIKAHRALLHKGRGELVDMSSPAIAQGIVKLLQNPDHAAEVARLAHEYMVAHHSDDAFTNFMRNMYMHRIGLGRKARGKVAPTPGSTALQSSEL